MVFLIYLGRWTAAVGNKIRNGERYEDHWCRANSWGLRYKFSWSCTDAFATTASRHQQLWRLLDTGRRRGCCGSCRLLCKRLLLLLLLIIGMGSRDACHSGPHWTGLPVTGVGVVVIIVTGWATRFPHRARIHADQAVPRNDRRRSQFNRWLCSSQGYIRLPPTRNFYQHQVTHIYRNTWTRIDRIGCLNMTVSRGPNTITRQNTLRGCVAHLLV